jgi:hypothetical protein
MYDREAVKNVVEKAVNEAFFTRKTVNIQLAVGFHAMIDAIFDELERSKKEKKVA